MRPSIVVLIPVIALSLSGTAVTPVAAANDRVVFTVPVSVAHLHADLTRVRARCVVFADENWRAGGSVIGQGTSPPYDTQTEDGTRGFLGDVDVPVLLAGQSTAAARSYACKLELFDATTQEWADADTLAQHYPINRASMTVVSIGGPLE